MQKFQFPDNFVWGVAAGSYQVEGGWNEGGKGESIWDRFVHIPGNIKDGTTADVTCDFYHRYEEDIALMKKLGYPNFLFTISWPRVIPDGTGELNREGIDYYRKVLTCLRENNITSYVVLYHWDLPQKLQDRGGWTNRESVGWFENYARIMYRELGDLVDHWITILEPCVISFEGYWSGLHAPGYHDYSAALQVAHHLNLAHGAAVRAYRETGLTGEIGVKISMNMVYPADPGNPDDVFAAKMLSYQVNDLFCGPIMKGEYPKELFDYLEKQGVVLPDIQPGDMEAMCPEIDFFGLNNYFAQFVAYDANVWPLPGKAVKTGRPRTPYNWEFCPDEFYDVLKLLNDTYHPKKIIITENGCASNDWVNDEGRCEDTNRIYFIRSYLKRAHRAIRDGIPLAGYFVWSFWDNFEWQEGLSLQFGLVHVNFRTLERTPKESAYWYSDVIRQNGFMALPESPGK